MLFSKCSVMALVFFTMMFSLNACGGGSVVDDSSDSTLSDPTTHDPTTDDGSQYTSPVAGDAPGVTGISVSHHDGQTFIAWSDPLAGSSGSVLRYKVYRSTSQIMDTGSATLIQDGVLNNNGQIHTGSLNQTSRVNEAIAMVKTSNGGVALDLWSGLAVHTATANEFAYYAVIAYDPTGVTYDGPSAISAGDNATTSPIYETISTPQPVLQRAQNHSPTNWDGSPDYPLFLSLHASNASGRFPWGEASAVGNLYSYWTPLWQEGFQSVFNVYQNRTAAVDRLILFPRDTVWNKAGTKPLETMWFGLSTTLLGDSPPNLAYPFTENRLDYLVPWVVDEYNVDENKIYSMGGSMGAWGTMSYAFRRPETFAAVFADRPRWRQRSISTDIRGSISATSTIQMYDGAGSLLDHYDAVSYVTTANSANDPLPPVAWGIGANDGFATFQEQIDAVGELTAGKRWFAFAWNDGNHSNSKAYAKVKAQYVDVAIFEKDVSYPVFLNSSIDDNPSTDIEGCINCGWSWETPTDTTNLYVVEISNSYAGTVTVNVTPRNTQEFSLTPGQSVSWTSSAGDSGTTTVDAMGLATAEGVTVNNGESTTVTFTPLQTTP